MTIRFVFAPTVATTCVQLSRMSFIGWGDGVSESTVVGKVGKHSALPWAQHFPLATRLFGPKNLTAYPPAHSYRPHHSIPWKCQIPCRSWKVQFSVLLLLLGGDSLDFDLSYDVHCGIAHTRWATHGPPNWVNSHPQRSDKDNSKMLEWQNTAHDRAIATVILSAFVVVHNGIVTNYKVLKEYLVSLLVRESNLSSILYNISSAPCNLFPQSSTFISDSQRVWVRKWYWHGSDREASQVHQR